MNRPAPSPVTGGRQALVRLVASSIGTDLRSLAAFRIGVASCVLFELVSLGRDLGAFYTDAGLLPRADAIEWFAEQAPAFSLSFIGGSLWSQALLFLLTAGAAACMLVGYRTRLATIVTWLLVTSIQLRNPLITFGADVFLRLQLFWAMFLPLGARYSVDAVRAPARVTPNPYVSIGTVALFVQVAIVFWIAGLAKWSNPIWADGAGVVYSLDHDLLVTRLGMVLQQYPALCRLLSYTVVFLELAGPLLLLSPLYPGPIRTAAVLALWMILIGFWVTLRVGLFPPVSMVALLAFLPAWLWDHLLAWLRTPQRVGLVIAVDVDCPTCDFATRLFQTFFLLPGAAKTRPRATGVSGAPHTWTVLDAAGTASSGYAGFLRLCSASPLLRPLVGVLRSPPLRRVLVAQWQRLTTHRAVPPRHLPTAPRSAHWTWLREGLAAAALLYVILWNVGLWGDAAYAAPPSIAWLGDGLTLQQRWGMFTRLPSTGWIAIPGTLKDGKLVNLFADGGPVPRLENGATTRMSDERPAVPSATFKSVRWLAFFLGITENPGGSGPLLYYGRYLCRSWNSVHDGSQQLDTFQIIYMTRPVGSTPRIHSAAEYERRVLWTHGCFR